MARYFLDCEFIEDGKTIDLISIALKRDDGEKFYRVSTEFDASKANDFVSKNVFPYLVDKDGNIKDRECWKSREQIKADLVEFVGDDKKPEFWAWYGSYDWICLAQLFGRMIDLPKNFPMFFHELKQLAEQKGNPKKPFLENAHHALSDAENAEQFYNKLIEMPNV